MKKRIPNLTKIHLRDTFSRVSKTHINSFERVVKDFFVSDNSNSFFLYTSVPNESFLVKVKSFLEEVQLMSAFTSGLQIDNLKMVKVLAKEQLILEFYLNDDVSDYSLSEVLKLRENLGSTINLKYSTLNRALTFKAQIPSTEKTPSINTYNGAIANEEL
jgi:hypothetical protein